MKRLVLVFVVLLLTTIAFTTVSAQEGEREYVGGPAFSAANNYMSDYGHVRYVVKLLSGRWINTADVKEFGENLNYMSYSGSIRYLVHNYSGKWMAVHDAKIVANSWRK